MARRRGIPDHTRIVTDDAWAALLDRFDHDLTGASGGDWAPAPGPVPPALADRARDLLHRQEQCIRRLRAHLDDLHRQYAALRRVPPARADVPALLDIDL